jgi:hypothetical protein
VESSFSAECFTTVLLVCSDHGHVQAQCKDNSAARLSNIPCNCAGHLHAVLACRASFSCCERSHQGRQSRLVDSMQATLTSWRSCASRLEALHTSAPGCITYQTTCSPVLSSCFSVPTPSLVRPSCFSSGHIVYLRIGLPTQVLEGKCDTDGILGLPEYNKAGWPQRCTL